MKPIKNNFFSGINWTPRVKVGEQIDYNTWMKVKHNLHDPVLEKVSQRQVSSAVVEDIKKP